MSLYTGLVGFSYGRSTSSSLKRMGGKVLLLPKTPGKASVKYPVEDKESGWTIDSKRVGALGVKIGMTNDWTNFGVMVPLTLIHLPNCQVVQTKTKEKDGVNAIQLGCQDTLVKRVSRSEMGHFARANIAPKKYIEEFQVTPDALLPEGTVITSRHFVPGQLVSVTGLSKGKGFQGVMKRWGFSGGFATHGASLSHRSLGATGARQDPGKVWKGKKMPGHMGQDRIQALNLKVYQIFPQINTIAVVGCVPGAPGTYLRIIDSLSNIFQEIPPFPTFTPKEGEKEPEVLTAKFKNPFHHVPELEENYWALENFKTPEKLINGKWEPDFRANLPSELLYKARRKLDELSNTKQKK